MKHKWSHTELMKKVQRKEELQHEMDNIDKEIGVLANFIEGKIHIKKGKYDDEIYIGDELVAVTHNLTGDIPALCVQQRYIAEFLEMYTWQGIVFRKRTKEDVKNEDY